MVLKPSEIAPISGIIFSEIVHAAGVPAGVYNMVNGDGPSVGQVMAGHPDVDMVSFTGSTRAGIIVAKTAADTVKRVAQELGGKSANIILPDADFETAVRKGVEGCFGNSGQSCDAPTRMLVPRDRHDEALAIAKKAAEAHKVGDPSAGGHDARPGGQRDPVRQDPAADRGRHQGRRHARHRRPRPAGGPQPRLLRAPDRVRPCDARHDHRARGDLRPGAVDHSLRRARTQAVEIANDTVYGLAAYVQSQGHRARPQAWRASCAPVRSRSTTRTGTPFAPFGGYKQSGNGREYADWAIHDFLEVKGIIGYGAA